MDFDYSEERENHVQVSFDRSVEKPTGFEIHRWVTDDMLLSSNDVICTQYDTFIDAVFLKLSTPELCDRLVATDGGKRKFRHLSGKISTVVISHAGFGVRQVRVFNLPIEIRDDTIKRYLSPYGDVAQVVNETVAK